MDTFEVVMISFISLLMAILVWLLLFLFWTSFIDTPSTWKAVTANIKGVVYRPEEKVLRMMRVGAVDVPQWDTYAEHWDAALMVDGHCIIEYSFYYAVTTGEIRMELGKRRFSGDWMLREPK